MLTIHSAINQNYQTNTAFGKRRRYVEVSDEQPKSEEQKLKEQYEADRAEWVEQKQNLEEMLANKEANLPKPLKTTMKGGAILAAGVLGGMATGYSAKYIMNAFNKMYKSKQIQSLVKSVDKHISSPLKKGFGAVKDYAVGKLAKFKKSDSYKNGKTKITEKYNKFNDLSFVKSAKTFAGQVADNKIVRKVTGAIDSVFSAIGNGVVKIYNKLAGINYKEAAVNTVGVAGGISTGAVTLMDETKKNQPKYFENFADEDYTSPYDEVEE